MGREGKIQLVLASWACAISKSIFFPSSMPSCRFVCLTLSFFTTEKVQDPVKIPQDPSPPQWSLPTVWKTLFYLVVHGTVRKIRKFNRTSYLVDIDNTVTHTYGIRIQEILWFMISKEWDYEIAGDRTIAVKSIYNQWKSNAVEMCEECSSLMICYLI